MYISEGCRVYLHPSIPYLHKLEKIRKIWYNKICKPLKPKKHRERKIKMKKGLGRELGQFIIFIGIILAVLAILWIATKLGFVLSWFGNNWLPFVIGFGTATVMKLFTTAFFDRTNRRHDHEE